MSSIAKFLLASLAALLLCVGEGALFAADTAAAGSTSGARELTLSEPAPPDYRPSVNAAIAQAVAPVDRHALSAYHERQVARAARCDPTIAQR
ncbi:MAG: hypothetical protein ACHQDD_02675 [Steroidobacterales bacterium]